MKKKVLFICTANSARSQMAEALFKSYVDDEVTVMSAGTNPSEVDPRAIDAIRQHGLNAEGLRSKSIDEVKSLHFDYVISLCEKATHECQVLPIGDKFLAWDFPDPKTMEGPNPFGLTLKDIDKRIKVFLEILNKENT